MLFRFFTKNKAAAKDAARRSLAAIMAQARRPFFYTDYRVPDTVDGRFELLAAHTVMLVARLSGESGETARARDAFGKALYDALLANLDVAMREQGVGDLSVGKQVRRIVEALNGRYMAYSLAMAQSEDAPWVDALARNLYGTLPEDAANEQARAVIPYWQRYADLLFATDAQTLIAGNISFPEDTTRDANTE